MQEGILQGIRVIEWGDLVSAPWTGRLLADMGADVIKVETPDAGDSARRVGPFPHDEPHIEKSGLYLYLNCNKRGVTLDVGKPEGRRMFKELVAGADILIESHSPGVVEELGLTYDNAQAGEPESGHGIHQPLRADRSLPRLRGQRAWCYSTWAASATRRRQATLRTWRRSRL